MPAVLNCTISALCYQAKEHDYLGASARAYAIGCTGLCKMPPMNPNEQRLHYPWGEALPAAGATHKVANDIHWLRMPLPFALDHINLWLLRDEINGRAGWTVVDCGVARDEVKALWQQVFAQALDGLPILRVIVTHMHPDHIGLAHWLCERWQAPLWMTMTDYVTARLWSRGRFDVSEPIGDGGSGVGGDPAVRHFARHGLSDPQAQADIRARARYYPGLVPAVPASFVRIMAGDAVQINGRTWRVVVGYGHAPEHASFYCDALRVLISGDMVLPRISTNISVPDHEPEANPLPLYLASLDQYQPLPEDTLVLPSHGKPFRGLHERIAQQHRHHVERLDEVLAACRLAPHSAAQIVPIMFRRKLDTHQLTFAMGEALAHLHALYYDGKVQRMTDGAGENAVLRFRAC